MGKSGSNSRKITQTAGLSARLAAHAVRPQAGPARSLPARHRDRGYRARPCARGALERADARASTPFPWRSIPCWSKRFVAELWPTTSARRSASARLLHDAPEYVIGDMISPFKTALGVDYKQFEARLETAIRLRFGLSAAYDATR